MIRTSFSGSVGASATIEVSTEFHIDPARKKEENGVESGPLAVKGISNDKNAPKLFSVDKKARTLDIKGHETEFTPAKAEIGAFAGGEINADISGAMQWLDPEGPAVDKKGNKKDFTDFANVDAGISGLAGIGLSGKFVLSFAKGKFRFLLYGGACLGLGLKGKCEFSVGYLTIFNFLKWFIYQLYHIGYACMTFVCPYAFKALSYMQFMACHAAKEVMDFFTEEKLKLEKEFAHIEEEFRSLIDKFLKRHQLALSIKANPTQVLHYLPECKGMMLYQLTRHGAAERIISFAQIATFQQSEIDDRKVAIIVILQTIQTVSEWNNVFQHMTKEGDKTDTAESEKTVRDVLGILGNTNMDPVMDGILKILKTAPTRGHPLVMNNSHDYSGQKKDDIDFGKPANSGLPINNLQTMHKAKT